MKLSRQLGIQIASLSLFMSFSGSPWDVDRLFFCFSSVFSCRCLEKKNTLLRVQVTLYKFMLSIALDWGS